VSSYDGTFAANRDSSQTLTAALRELYKGLDQSREGFPPVIFWQVRGYRFCTWLTERWLKRWGTIVLKKTCATIQPNDPGRACSTGCRRMLDSDPQCPPDGDQGLSSRRFRDKQGICRTISHRSNDVYVGPSLFFRNAHSSDSHSLYV
jgi:hypothetical protein